MEKKRIEGVIVKACKNVASRLFSRKKKHPTFSEVLVPQNSLKPTRDNVVSTNSSDDDTSLMNRSSGDEANNSDNDSDPELSPFVLPKPSIRFSLRNNVLEAVANFEYLFDYFKHALSNHVKPMEVDKMVDDICDHSFLKIHNAVHAKAVKRETYRQLSYIVQSAYASADNGTCIKILRERHSYSFVFKSLCPLRLTDSLLEFVEYRGENSSHPVLLIRDNQNTYDIIQIHAFAGGCEVTVGGT